MSLIVITVVARDHRRDGRGNDDTTLRWFLRSLGDVDTHRGRLRGDGTVLAGCGARFTPRPTLRIAGPAPGQLVGRTCAANRSSVKAEPIEGCAPCAERLHYDADMWQGRHLDEVLQLFAHDRRTTDHAA